MIASASVIIPVLNGEEYLEELLAALAIQKAEVPYEVLVIDSGSTDRSLEIVRTAGVRLIEIPPSEYGHGRTRNFGMTQTTGDLVCFLTQDATPAGDGWLQGYIDAFKLHPRVGAAYGPHLPRPGVNPLMARLLTDHFGGMSQDGKAVVHHPGDITFLSNTNSALARSAWQEIPFRDIAYAEDQAMGMDLLDASWRKVYAPAAAVWHSHDYGLVESWKRYFDEYRGLHDSIGTIEALSPLTALKRVAAAVVADWRYIGRERDRSSANKLRWQATSVVHHAGRVVMGGIGARSNRVSPALRAAFSLEERSDGVLHRVPAPVQRAPYDEIRVISAGGHAPLVPAELLDPKREKLDIAWVVPPFAVGSGGHTTIFRMVRALEQRGHRCSIYVHDPGGLEPYSGAAIRNRVIEKYMPIEASVRLGLDGFAGADVCVATGWQTAHPVMSLPNCRARAYFVQDHEPEFYPTGSESLFAESTYRLGMPAIAASPWLAQLLRDRYGAEAIGFELGVDGDEYFSLDFPRRNDMIVFYARNFTPRRAVELGVLALADVVERHPHLRVVLYGTEHILPVPFAYEHLGVVGPDRLRRIYAEATIGVSLSLTNYSLIPAEMMSCGLPVVELAGRACESVFGDDGSVITLAEANPTALSDAIEGLLTDEPRRKRLSIAGREFVKSRTWQAAADVVEQGLLDAYRSRARGAVRTPEPAEWQAGSLI
ncbi:MAG: glycosyltransferase [Solirubrobacterales bacterium]